MNIKNKPNVVPRFKDIWNAIMFKDAKFYIPSDNPFFHSTAQNVPSKLLSYIRAKTLNNKAMKFKNTNFHYDAFTHFYIDIYKFESKESSIWLYPKEDLKIIEHYLRIIIANLQIQLVVNHHYVDDVVAKFELIKKKIDNTFNRIVLQIINLHKLQNFVKKEFRKHYEYN